MEFDTFTAPQYATSDPASFAHTSARERWPIIITQGIDDVHKSTWARRLSPSWRALSTNCSTTASFRPFPMTARRT
jgi:hypothetical protein